VKNGVLSKHNLYALKVIETTLSAIIDALPECNTMDKETKRVFDHMLNARSFTRLALAGQKEGK